jgi:hypothetical protein
MSTSNLGTLTSTPRSYNDLTVTTSDPTDVYKFNITSTSSINLSLNEISWNDDADLYLYRDSNGNGSFDDGIDQEVTRSWRSNFSNGAPYDDMINTRANAGTYFAVVRHYASDSPDGATYDLDLSATPTQPSLSSPPPNLLPYEVFVGHAGNLQDSDQTFNGSVGDSNTADLYYFTLGPGDHLNGIRLSGLSADADIRLIRDSNNNRIVDADEVIGSSTNGGNTEEWISGTQLQIGPTYLLQVYQYSSNTNYQLTFDVA